LSHHTFSESSRQRSWHSIFILLNNKYWLKVWCNVEWVSVGKEWRGTATYTTVYGSLLCFFFGISVSYRSLLCFGKRQRGTATYTYNKVTCITRKRGLYTHTKETCKLLHVIHRSLSLYCTCSCPLTCVTRCICDIWETRWVRGHRIRDILMTVIDSWTCPVTCMTRCFRDN